MQRNQQLRELSERLRTLSDQELLAILDDDPDNWTAEGLALANNEVNSRGGLDKLREQERLAREHRERQDEEREREEQQTQEQWRREEEKGHQEHDQVAREPQQREETQRKHEEHGTQEQNPREPLVSTNEDRAAMRHWYYHASGQQKGPCIENDFVRLFQTGELSADTLIWTEGLEEWHGVFADVDILSMVRGGREDVPVLQVQFIEPE